jgi:hypothetical protein
VLDLTSVSREALYHPLCGDVWRLDDGEAFVVDYKDGLMMGMTFLDGSQRGVKYTNAFAAWVKRRNGKLVSSFEQRPLPWNCDERGWTKNHSEKTPTGGQSVSFLKFVLLVAAYKWPLGKCKTTS